MSWHRSLSFGLCARRMPYAFAFALVLGGAAVCSPALAQSPEVRRDSLPQDSLPKDSVYSGQIHSPGMYLILPLTVGIVGAYSAVFLVAPPALLLWTRAATGAATAFTPKDSLPLESWQRHVHAYVAAGPAFTDEPGGSAWAHSENLEILRDGMYAEVRLEHFYLPDYLQYETVRVGYLHGRRTLLGGATIGYREAHGVLGQSGLEIGLPLMISGRYGWGRVEPTYVVSRTGADWNFRGQIVWPRGDGRFFWGMNAEAKALPLPLRKGRGLTASTVALLFGTRY